MTDNDESSNTLWEKNYLLSQVGGNAALVIQLLDMFLADTPNQINELTGAVEQSNCTEVASLAHTLKGAALNLGINSFAAIAKQIEMDAKSNNFESIKKQLPLLKPAFEKVRLILEDYKNTQE